MGIIRLLFRRKKEREREERELVSSQGVVVVCNLIKSNQIQNKSNQQYGNKEVITLVFVSQVPHNKHTVRYETMRTHKTRERINLQLLLYILFCVCRTNIRYNII